ncbi:MAG: hypothetical protein CM15mP18_2090 [Methanobacteriota archaeon]|nr:MAG: hypothetical protein CM15mP18_2090 [Euryarchaeota archaeon]
MDHGTSQKAWFRTFISVKSVSKKEPSSITKINFPIWVLDGQATPSRSVAAASSMPRGSGAAWKSSACPERWRFAGFPYELNEAPNDFSVPFTQIPPGSWEFSRGGRATRSGHPERGAVKYLTNSLTNLPKGQT